MATRAKALSPAKAPATGKAAARSKPVAKAAATPAKPVAAKKATSAGKPAVKTVVAPAKQSRPAVKKTGVEAKLQAAKSARPPVSEEQRRNYIEVAAYYIAERRGFFGASALEDWTQAEAEVDRMLSEGKLNQ